MSYDTKSFIIQTSVVLVSGVVTFLLMIFFQSKGLDNLTKYCISVPFTMFGLYVLFGKYIYLYGLPITKPLRIGTGLFYILIAPLMWLIHSLVSIN